MDEVVFWFGTRVENDLAETVEVGMGAEKKYEPRYALADLLDPDFRVPRPLPTPRRAKMSSAAAMFALAAQSNGFVRRWEFKPS